MDQNVADLTKEEIVQWGKNNANWNGGPTGTFQGSCYVTTTHTPTQHGTLIRGTLLVSRQKDHLIYPSELRDHIVVRDKDEPDACLSWIDQ